MGSLVRSRFLVALDFYQGFLISLFTLSYTETRHEASVRVPNHPTLIRRMLNSRLRKVAAQQPLLAASLSFYSHHCGRAECRCRHGGPLHETQHVTYKEDGKTCTVYVPKDLIPEVRAWIAQHRRLKSLLQEIQQLTLALIRTHVRHRRRQAGRT